MRFIVCLFSVLISKGIVIYGITMPLQSHEQWWESYAGAIGFWPNLEMWHHDNDKLSRKKMREYLKQQQYESILDIPCGAGADFYGLIQDSIEIAYQGVEITPKLVDFCHNHGVPVVQGSIERIPFANETFDIAYARHILEHLSYYHTALKELIRAAKKEVLVVFFIPPRPKLPDKINLYVVRGLPLYNNWYNKEMIDDFVSKQERVAFFSWQKISAAECFLHIYLN